MEKITVNLSQLREFYTRQATDADMIINLVDGANALAADNQKLKDVLAASQAEVDALKALPKEPPKGE